MDEMQPEPKQASAPLLEPAPAASAPPAPAEESQTSIAEKIKAWGDAATALFKAVLLALAILFVSVVSGVVVWRDRHSRVVLVDVNPDAEKTLRALGVDIDLRLALVDALNERLHGVQQIVAVQGLGYATDSNQSDAISFKPFGLELSTYDITRIVGVVFDRPARPAARLELLCAPVTCTDPTASKAMLVVSLTGPNGYRNESYPVALGSPGLRRSLLQSVQRTADLMLEQNEPLIASVLFLNRGLAQDVFTDQRLHDLIRAEGAAVAAAHGSDDFGCLADLVIGGSLSWRIQLADGVAAERRAAASADMTCKVHAETNIVFILKTFAVCGRFAVIRRDAHDKMMEALQRLPKLRRGAVDDLVYFRISAAQLSAEIAQVLEKAGVEAALAACFGTTAPQTGRRGAVAEGLRTILDHAQEKLPPAAKALMQHEIFEYLWIAMQASVPRDDLAGRLSMARAMMEAVRHYEVNDQHPRALFALQGKLAMEIAWAASDALDQTPAEQIRLARELGADSAAAQSQARKLLTEAIDENLDVAIVAFENAEATSALAPLVEPVSDVQVGGLLGDALYAKGEEALARNAYARALDKFVDAGEPVEQVFAVADTLARWASLLIAAGACEKDALPDRAWEDSWSRLGGVSRDVCRLAKQDGGAGQPAPLASIKQLIKDAVMGCLQPPEPDETKQLKPLDAFKKRVALIDCQRVKGAGDIYARSLLSAEAVDAEIARALGTRR